MGRTGRGRSAPAHLGYCDGDEGGPRRRPPRGADPLGLRDHLASLTSLEHGPVRERPEVRRPRKQLPPRLGVGGTTMKTLVIGLGTFVLVALGRPALAQRCLSFRPPAFFAGAGVAPGYPYPAYGYPAYYPYPLPPAPSLGFGRGGIYGP